MPDPIRKFHAGYNHYGFVLHKSVEGGEHDEGKCLLCAKSFVLKNNRLKSNLVKQHFINAHRQGNLQALPLGEDGFAELLKKRKLMVDKAEQDFGYLHSESKVLLSFKLAELVGMSLKPYYLCQELIWPSIEIVVGAIFGKEGLEKIKGIPVSAGTIASRIKTMSTDIKDQIVEKMNLSQIGFAVQLDETTDINNRAQLVCCVRYLDKSDIVEEVLFLREVMDAKSQTLFDTFC